MYITCLPISLAWFIVDLFFNRSRFSAAINVIFCQAIIYFLDFLRDGVKNLDDWEIRHEQNTASKMEEYIELGLVPNEQSISAVQSENKATE